MTTTHRTAPATGRLSDRSRLAVVAVGALLVALVAGLGVALSTSGPDPLEAQQECRTAARTVFAAVVAERMSQADGQARVDAACADADATSRRAILDAERAGALANMPAPVPTDQGGTITTSPASGG